jgi:protein-tyrosine phosphatase
MRARQFRSGDFEEFDLIVPMDKNNLRDISRWSGAVTEKVKLARSFDPTADGEVVPDPYYGDLRDFEDVAKMLEAACKGILDTVDGEKMARYS